MNIPLGSTEEIRGKTTGHDVYILVDYQALLWGHLPLATVNK